MQHFKSMLVEAQRLIQGNAGPALLTAAVLGFCVARRLSRPTDLGKTSHGSR